MNDKRASRRVCANCKQIWNNSAMTRRGKRYVCPDCARTEKHISALRRAQARWIGPEEVRVK